MESKTSVNQTQVVKQRSPDRYSELDTIPFGPISFGSSSLPEIAKLSGITKKSATRLVAFRNKYKAAARHQVPFHLFFDKENANRLQRTLLFQDDKRTIITNVAISEGKIMSDRRYSLRVFFTGEISNAPLLVSIEVKWKGSPFTVEKMISRELAKKGYADILFGKEQSLPVGLAVFYVSLYNNNGSLSSFRVSAYTLPSNPFSLDLSPRSNFVTGTYSARAVKQGGNYATAVNLTLSNGNTFAVSMRSAFTWKFWDGGIGGSLVENGTGNFNTTITVPASGTWGGSVNFNSPPGSGIFNKFNNKEDLSIEIIMTRANGSNVSGSITARTMFKFGVNLTRVSPRDFVGQENTDLQTAIQVTRSIYERTDVTLDHDNRFIPDSQVGGFEVIDSDNEVRDLWDQWSGPDTNHNIDAFITQVDIDGKYDGMDGDIPGPTSHAGRSSGVVANKAGYVDASGHPRLHVEYLGMLMGHELGHYLGLQHVDTAHNLMLPDSGTNDTTLSYDQYRTIIRHGWMSID